MRVAVRIQPFGVDLRDARGRASIAAIEQERADIALHAEWQRRVRANPKEIAALPARRRAVL